MNEIKDELDRLVEAHPLLFRGAAPQCHSYLLEGWYGLVDRLCADIERAAGPEGCQQIEVRQIKEKFGMLRVYLAHLGQSDVRVDVLAQGGAASFRAAPPRSDRVREVQRLVDAAEGASSRICEECGRPGRTLSDRGWRLTRCDEHARKGAQPCDPTQEGAWS